MSVHWDPNWLREKYYKEDLSCREMGDIAGVDAMSIINQMEKHGLERTGTQRKKKPFEDCKIPGGKQNFYSSTRWKRTAEKVRKRDNYRCLSCGTKQADKVRKLSVHHIDPLAEIIHECGKITDEAFDTSNLISLCDNCHQTWENLPVRPQFTEGSIP